MRQDIPTQFFEKFVKQQSTERDYQQFNEWLHAASKSEIEDVLDKYAWYFQNQADEMHPESDRLTTDIIQRISASDGFGNADEAKTKKKTNKIFFSPALGKVAVLAVTLSFIALLYHYKSDAPRQSVNITVHGAKRKIVPGGNKAVLILADGSSIMLDSAKNGVLCSQNNVHIYKMKNGQVLYDPGTSKSASNDKPTFNTLITPRGGQYQLILPDGTKVWLNSESELRYPSAFRGKQRSVQLSGEAYFEVAKDRKHPFTVSINDMQVEVLGTHFNVMGYKDESSTKTTLLEGSVRIIKAGSQKLIVPGEQATVAEHIDIATVNTEEAIEWKKGNFSFSHEKLGSIMRKIARWYDIEVDYQGKTSSATFVGTIPRSKNIGEVLKYLELTGLVHFKVNERRITVMP